jgi:hypothetical protein
MILDMQPKLFWTSTNFFGRVQIILVRLKLKFSGVILDVSKMIWTLPKQIGLVQNYWYSTKKFWAVQNHFGPIEGQGITFHILFGLLFPFSLWIFNLFFNSSLNSFFNSYSIIYQFLFNSLLILSRSNFGFLPNFCFLSLLCSDAKIPSFSSCLDSNLDAWVTELLHLIQRAH